MKVLFYTNIPSPYRVHFFNELGKHCELTVVFETANSTERDETWKKFEFTNFEGVILKGIRTRVDAAFCPGIVKYLKKDQYDHIVVTQLASLTAIWAVAYMRMKGISYFYEGDGGFVGSTKGVKAFLKRFIIKNAKVCLSTSEEFDKYCMAYGAKKEKIKRYPFTSIEKKDILEKPLTKEEKADWKRKLNIEEEYVILSVGSFIHRKGFDLLLNASRDLPANIGVYIVGGKATEEYLEMQRKWNLQNVHFADFMSKSELKKYYYAADLFAFPTREDIWGLVINEAMAYALPVITTDRCIAGIEMVESGKNGYIVKTEDIEDLSEKMLLLAENERKQNDFAKETLKKIEKYTIEEMTQCHLEIFNNLDI